ncbi:MAG: methyltransferase domain-containing protein [Candidatus Omnitrophica bacterium]|nr:methyltransferase domain-containing protein [Candidatus Omnitrophota bacterium]
MDERISRELQHDQKIAGMEKEVWGWASPAGRLRAKRRTRLLIESTSLGKGGRVLEIGCGTGVFTAEFACLNPNVVALDLSYAFMDKVRKDVDAVFVAGSAEELPFADSTFDVVVGSSVLHHLKINQALSEIYRVVRGGGLIAFAEPNMANPQIFLQKNIPWLKTLMGDSADETAFFRWKAASLLEEAGFEEIRVTPYDFLHPMTPSSWIHRVEKAGLLMENIPLVREIAGSLIISARKGTDGQKG